MPDFSTLSRRQKSLTVDIPYRGSDGSLHLLIDSTGIKVEGEGEWHSRKYGASKHRIWRKLHIAIDEGSLEIRAVEMTGKDVGDAPILPVLLAQIPEDEDITSVTADGTYDARRCHETIAERGAQAIIPPRKNAKPWSPTTSGAIARNEALRGADRLGRTIWRWWSGYHRRSRVEAKMHCIKLLGQRLSARDFNRQITEFHVRVAILNRFTALGTLRGLCGKKQTASCQDVACAQKHFDIGIICRHPLVRSGKCQRWHSIHKVMMISTLGANDGLLAHGGRA